MPTSMSPYLQILSSLNGKILASHAAPERWPETGCRG